MPNSGVITVSEVITVEMLTEAEQRLATSIEQPIERIYALRNNCAIGGILSLTALLVTILFTPEHSWPERLYNVVGHDVVPFVYLAGGLAVAVGCTIWYFLYARPRIRRQLAILRELAANPEMPRLRWKLHQMRAAEERLAWPASLELRLANTAFRSIRRLFPKFTI